MASEVRYLGYLINAEGSKPLSERVKAILEFPKPTTVMELRRFLRMITFSRRFVKGAIKNQASLYKYLQNSKKKDKRPIVWTVEAEEAFQACKHDLVNTTLLAHLADDAPLILHTVSDTTIKVSLEQQIGEKNVVADILLRIETIAMPLIITTEEIAKAQSDDKELQQLLNFETALNLTRFLVNGHTIFCDTTRKYQAIRRRNGIAVDIGAGITGITAVIRFQVANVANTTNTVHVKPCAFTIAAIHNLHQLD
ncbi:uncharacterized protein LOC112590263 [Harpegnathos saltator]|uniref:uncharacterized protein LOC112590263 n=1 Tax=Harpegnathos saltator TaxID=610380 RepID=UPI000DBEED6A|nr:uncharacterized protein LOC112590263 [Harpegnathos saltator]